MADEIARRLVHASGTTVPAAYLLDGAVVGSGLITWRVVQGVFVVGAVVALILEALRLRVGLDWAIYDRLTREYEADNPAGYALYMIGAAIVTVVFPPSVAPGLAVAAILMLTIGDPVSGLLSSGGPEGVKDRFVMGITFAVCLGLALPLLPVRAAVPAAVAAVVADSVKPEVAGYVIDDNISIPIGAAVAGFLALSYLPALL